MADWQKVIAQHVANVEEHFDLLKYRLRERLGGRDPIMILAYRGYGTPEKLYLKGRVLEDRGIESAMEDDTVWDNLVNMYKRFKSNEIPYARVLVRFQGVEQEIQTDLEGFFDAWIKPVKPLPGDQCWHPVKLELLHPLREEAPPVQAEGQVLVPPPSAHFGVISDIDDTVLHTDATNIIRMARTVFLGNAHTRLPFKGVAAFYRALFEGAARNEMNPLFYVSSSPWNMYDLLSDFFNLQDIPLGPVLFLRDWGISEEELLPAKHRSHKLDAIQKIMHTYAQLPFILIGDSGQEDPEIYHEVVHDYPDRILAVYIRNVSLGRLRRSEAIQKLAEEVAAAGSTLILAENTLPMAEHAASQGWIAPEALREIQIRKEEDEAPPSPLEQLIGEDLEEEEPPLVVIEGEPDEVEKAVEAGAIEEALEAEKEESKKPPTVVIKAEDEDKES
jgi:phosphatidate phosphatase APP1